MTLREELEAMEAKWIAIPRVKREIIYREGPPVVDAAISLCRRAVEVHDQALVCWNAEGGRMAAEIARLRAELKSATADDDHDLLALSIQWIAGDDGQWQDEFLAWYRPDQWFGEHRAVQAFLAKKVSDYRSRLADAEQRLTQAEGLLREWWPHMDEYMDEMCDDGFGMTDEWESEALMALKDRTRAFLAHDASGDACPMCDGSGRAGQVLLDKRPVACSGQPCPLCNGTGSEASDG